MNDLVSRNSYNVFRNTSIKKGERRELRVNFRNTISIRSRGLQSAEQ